MIRYIKGVLGEYTQGEVVIENNGIGYLVSVPVSVMDQLPQIGQEVMLYTYLHVREDNMQLFGFVTKEDLNIFQLLITVSGIGPKAALGILGSMTAYDIRYAVMADDAKAIAKAPGIGPKTAGKVILELKDKLSLEDLVPEQIPTQEAQKDMQDNHTQEQKEMVRDAIEALVVLGYPKVSATKAVRMVPWEEGMTTERLLKESLKNM